MKGKSTLGNGWINLILEKEEAAKFGQMVLYTLDTGLIIRLLDMADSYMKMVMYIKEVGTIIRPKVSESIPILMEPNMKVIGIKTKSTVKA